MSWFKRKIAVDLTVNNSVVGERIIINNKNQNDKVLGIFMSEEKALTPYEVHVIYEKNHVKTPITSIRRSISNLTFLDKLTMTSDSRMGGFGKPNYTWKLKTN